MRTLLLFAALLVFLGFAAPAQTDLPEIGTLADLKDKTQYYLIADADNEKHMLKELKRAKGLVRVNKPEEASFFIEYKHLSRSEPQTGLGLTSETGELQVYFRRDGKKVVAWRDAETSTMKRTAIVLVKRFLKAIKP